MKIHLHTDSDGGSFFHGLSEELIKEEGEVCLVLAECKTSNSNRTDFLGLDFALSLNVKFPIIFCSFLSEVHFAQLGFGEKFLALIAKKGTGFLRLPFTNEELLEKYHELLHDDKEEDLLAIEINRVNTYQSTMARIQHKVQGRLGRTDNDSKLTVASAVVDARNFGLTGTDEEIIQLIKDYEYKPQSSFYAGKFFPGVFVDIEGTILNGGELNKDILNQVKEFAGKKPITLWTGGEIKSLIPILISHGIFWKVVSKYDFAGAEVEVAFDNENQEMIQKKYGVSIREFVQI